MSENNLKAFEPPERLIDMALVNFDLPKEIMRRRLREGIAMSMRELLLTISDTLNSAQIPDGFLLATERGLTPDFARSCMWRIPVPDESAPEVEALLSEMFFQCAAMPGLSLEGARLEVDAENNLRVYGTHLSPNGQEDDQAEDEAGWVKATPLRPGGRLEPRS